MEHLIAALILIPTALIAALVPALLWLFSVTLLELWLVLTALLSLTLLLLALAHLLIQLPLILAVL
jgi:hypothetical protein